MRYFLMILVLVFAGAPVYAEDAASDVTSIAVVDVRALLTESKAAKSIQGQIKSHRDKFVKGLASEEKAVSYTHLTLPTKA